jgi:DNA-binding MarR family transcriptional regulator
MLLGEVLGATRVVFLEQEWGGLRPSHLRVVSSVPDAGCTVTELAALVGMTKQGCGQFVTTLVASGHLAEARAATDRRVRLVSRTPAGDAALVRTAELMASLEDHWRDLVGARRYATFRSVLEQLSAEPAGSAGGSPHG